MYSQVKVSPLAGDKYEILEDIIYKDIVIPKGYKTNGADIPRAFWSYMPPNKSDILPAVIVHDFLCDLEQYEKADKYFEEVLILLGIRGFDLFVLTKSVRVYHKVKYKI